MRSMFDDLLAIADEALGFVNAEPVVLRPQTRSSNGRALPDEDRPVVSTVGVFDLGTEPVGVQLGNRETSRGSNDLRTLRSASTPVLSVLLVDLGGVEVRQGDRVDLPDRGTGRRFEIVSAAPDGHGRVELELVER